MISSNIVLIFNVYHVLNHGAVRHNFNGRSRFRRFSHPLYLYRRPRTDDSKVPSVSITKGDKQWQTITPMLLGESIMLILLTFPFSIQLAISGYSQEFYHNPNHAMLFSVTFYMLYTNKCVTFFVYLATGSRFRRELRDLFLTCIRGKKAMRRQKFMKSLLWINAFSQNMANSNTIKKKTDNTTRPRLLSASV
ncbi:hypothetical protein FSP39_013401 [Pinctada imbricata]|uniref:G-protein coupled receptors family 1 profile domain-containing protein n=1 Tax=Pinctada imbricata TaxID=66713 RepID=A0AA88YDF9_PINIB|nr:hypothetical protein FSP39_013401 [Pinctada imbricata]